MTDVGVTPTRSVEEGRPIAGAADVPDAAAVEPDVAGGADDLDELEHPAATITANVTKALTFRRLVTFLRTAPPRSASLETAHLRHRLCSSLSLGVARHPMPGHSPREVLTDDSFTR